MHRYSVHSHFHPLLGGDVHHRRYDTGPGDVCDDDADGHSVQWPRRNQDLRAQIYYAKFTWHNCKYSILESSLCLFNAWQQVSGLPQENPTGWSRATISMAGTCTGNMPSALTSQIPSILMHARAHIYTQDLWCWRHGEPEARLLPISLRRPCRFHVGGVC
jgi:hypothetical protein